MSIRNERSSLANKQSFSANKRIDWEDINIKAGIAFTLASIAILLAVYLLTK